MSQTITKSELAKGDFITRTVRATVAHCKVIDLTSFELSDMDFTVSGDMNPIKLGREIEKRYSETLIAQNKKLVKVVSKSTIEKRFAMSVAVFAENAFEIVDSDTDTDTVK